jgi:hypothetical protein
MLLTDLLKSLRVRLAGPRQPRGRRATPATSRRPGVEQLDDRFLPSTGLTPEAGHVAVAHRAKSGHHHPNHFLARFPNRSITPVVTEGVVATLRGTINDGDVVHGTFILQVNWDDGTPTQVFSFPPRGQVEIPHTYTVLGQHTVHLVWKDLLDGSFGPARTADLTILVIV